MHPAHAAVAVALAFTAAVLAPVASAYAAAPVKQVVFGEVAWKSLTREQQTALQPLKPHWASLGEANQRKWMALARNYNRLSPAEQATLQRRMIDWANLSASERNRARLNFGEVRRVPPAERRTKWEQYQALPPEERERLAHDRPKPLTTAAPALQPAPPSPLVHPVRPIAQSFEGASPEGRLTLPINRNTLLPLRPEPDRPEHRR